MLRRPEVEKTVGLSRSAIYAAMSRSDFPRPVQIGRRAVAWRSTDIEHWLENRPPSIGWI
ncbi:AlpA family phage regulatory protein [Microvirga sp. SRT01]|nr:MULTISPECIES: AlpA family phage regulatory protein [Alphaproteobacteria]MBR7710913.1 AlpA family phage regulatory protein [Microvirga sp. SRT01]